MEILKVLEDKKTCLKYNAYPFEVPFSISDIEVLADEKQLQCLKLIYTFPDDYVVAADILDCASKILKGDTLYRVLEFCIRKNQILKIPVIKVFPRFSEVV